MTTAQHGDPLLTKENTAVRHKGQWLPWSCPVPLPSVYTQRSLQRGFGDNGGETLTLGKSQIPKAGKV